MIKLAMKHGFAARCTCVPVEYLIGQSRGGKRGVACPLTPALGAQVPRPACTVGRPAGPWGLR
jgi:hypothetical protein